MDLILYFIDWKKARLFKEKGRFEEEFNTARDRNKSWVQLCEEFPAFDAYYFTVAKAFQSSRDALPPAGRESAVEFFQGVIAENSVCQDFGDEPLFCCDREPGRFFHSISPESAARLAALGHQLDWDVLKAAYSRKVSQRDRKELAALSLIEGGKDGFASCFRPYVELWIELLDRACSTKKGILTELQ